MIQIKEEFKQLIPALTPEEFSQLETNCLRDGILSPICLWNGFIIDGHNRYEISLRHQLEFESVDFNFDSEEDVKNWMIEKQLGQRNLTKEQKDYLIGKRYENEKQRHGGSRGKNFPLNTTAEKIAEEVGISDRQVKINEQFAQGVDKMSDELKQQVLQGNSNINKADIQLISKAEPTFIANTDKEIIEKAKEIKEQKAEAYKQKITDRIESKVKETPLSIDEQQMLDAIDRGETVVINMNVHFHVLKYAKDKGIYKQIDRYSEFGNPFWLDSDGTRDEVCDGYIEYFKHKRSLHEKVKELKGKVLGCHCAPLRCHGEHLKELANDN
jgi:hypothetical protein